MSLSNLIIGFIGILLAIVDLSWSSIFIILIFTYFILMDAVNEIQQDKEVKK